LSPRDSRRASGEFARWSTLISPPTSSSCSPASHSRRSSP
jgi:hypothetical protein